MGKSLFPVATRTIFDSGEAPGDHKCCTVAISSYNYAKHITETLDSVVSQTHPLIELIVIDDKSPDNSIDVIDRWMKENHSRFTRCRLVAHVDNQGLAQSRNTAFQLAETDYVFVLDSDNHLLPRCLERHIEVIRRTGAPAVYAIAELFGDVKGLGPADIFDRNRLKKANYIDAMALVSRAAWVEIGGYATYSTMGWEDYDMWLSFAERDMPLVFIPEVLCRYRTHNTSMQQTMTGPKGNNLNIEISSRHPWIEL